MRLVQRWRSAWWPYGHRAVALAVALEVEQGGAGGGAAGAGGAGNSSGGAVGGRGAPNAPSSTLDPRAPTPSNLTRHRSRQERRDRSRKRYALIAGR